MKKSPPKGQGLYTIVGVFPFLSAIILLLIGLFTLDDVALDPPFTINVWAVLILAGLQLVTIIILERLGKIEIKFPNKPRWKKPASISAQLFMLILMNFLFTMGLRMNLNYWFKGGSIQKIELIVIGKDLSHGKATDYYIRFNSPRGALNHKVSRKNFDSFSIGDKYIATVQEGFFEGYFLTEPLK
jgi:hypothetical protein